MSRQESLRMILDGMLENAVIEMGKAMTGQYKRTWGCDLAETKLQSIYDNVLMGKDKLVSFKEACDGWIQAAIAGQSA